MLCLRCHERQSRWKTASRKAGCRVARSELFGGASKGRDKQAIGFIDLTPDTSAGSMNEGGWRFLRSLRPVVWMLTENGGNAERLFAGFGALRCKLAFNLRDQRGGTLAPGGFGEALPAGKRGEDQSFTSGEAQPVKDFAPAVSCVLLGAIKPKAFDRSAFGEGSGGMDSRPIAGPLDQSFFRAMAQDISQSPDLCGLLSAHQD